MSMPTKEHLRDIVRECLDEIIKRVNGVLRGQNVNSIRPILERVGRGGKVPHWFDRLVSKGVLPHLDGKSIGSVIEMVLIGILEVHTFKGLGAPPLRVNPARGVDLPDLDLGVKSPSENFCTSEPFFSAYERLYGSEYDALVLLTDFQTAKDGPLSRLQIIKWEYVAKSQLADVGLCRIARKHRARLLKSGESRAKRLFRFLAYVNQSDWLGRKLVLVIDAMDNRKSVKRLVDMAEVDFVKTNALRERTFRQPLPDSSIHALREILKSTPLMLAITDAADNWIAENLKEAGRLPNDNEWNRLKTGPLDGRIGMSFALQWRYNFGRLFGEQSDSAIDVPSSGVE